MVSWLSPFTHLHTYQTGLSRAKAGLLGLDNKYRTFCFVRFCFHSAPNIMWALTLVNILFLSTKLTAGDEYDRQNPLFNVLSVSTDEVKGYGTNNMIRSTDFTKRQTQIAKKIEKAQEEQSKIDQHLAKANAKLQQLINQQTYTTNSGSGSTSAALINKQKNVAKEIDKVERKIEELGLKAALTRTLLEQLNKQLRSAPASPINTNSLTKTQQTLELIINAAQIEKEDLELENALANTMLGELKKQQVYVTGSDGTTVVSNTDKSKKLASEINKYKEKQQELTVKLAMATTMVEQLQKQRSSLSSSPTDLVGLTNKQKALFEKINSARENKNNFELQAALLTTYVEELRKQQAAYTNSAGLYSKEDAAKLTKLNNEIIKGEEKKDDLTIKFALAKTLLEQMEKQWISETSNSVTIKTAINNRQKVLKSKINDAKEDKDRLELEAALADTLVEELKKQQSSLTTKTGSNANYYENKMKKLNSEITKSEEKMLNLTLKLALARKMLEQLEKQWNTARSSLSVVNGMTNRQKSLVNKINNAKGEKENLELQAALTETLVDELKRQQNYISTKASLNTNHEKKLRKLASEINKGEDKKQELIMKLALATKMLEELEKQMESSTSRPPAPVTEISGERKSLIKKMNKAQETKEDLEMEAALAKTFLEELQKQHNVIVSRAGAGSNNNKNKLERLLSDITKAKKKIKQLDNKLQMANSELVRLKTQLN